MTYAPHIERDEQADLGRLPAGEAQEGGDWKLSTPPRPSPPSASQERRDAGLCGICRKPVPPRAYPGGSPKEHCSPGCRRIAWERAHPGRRGWQAAIPGESRVERRFAEWIETPAGRYVEAEVLRLALERRRAGRRRGEINLLCALVRDQSYGLGKDEQGYAVNNSYRSLLARRLMAEHPELEGWFETRDLRGVA